MSLTYPAIPKFYRALFVIMFCPFAVSAQLSIAFSPDKAGGCAPLPVHFTSQVSGASAAAVYSWDFGNGNKSDLPNPGAVFKNTGSFMVTLVVKDGNDSRSVTKQIDVTPAPAADFKISTTRGCAPLDVIFTATTTSGLVSNYTGDFSTEFTRSEDPIPKFHSHLMAFEFR